jgi:hypothetical protein
MTGRPGNHRCRTAVVENVPHFLIEAASVTRTRTWSDRVLTYRSIARRERAAAITRAVPSAENRSTILKPRYLLGTLAPDQTSCKSQQTANLQALRKG